MTDNELQTIADDIACYSDGAFHIAWDEEFEALDRADQEIVRERVFEQLGNCGLCGWHHLYDSMETHSDGEHYCWRCYEDMLEEEEEE